MSIDWFHITIPKIEEIVCDRYETYVDKDGNELYETVVSCKCYKCSECSFVDRNNDETIKHIMLEHFGMICNDYFDGYENYTNNISICSDCHLSIAYDELQEHIELHKHFIIRQVPNNTEYICRQCDKKFRQTRYARFTTEYYCYRPHQPAKLISGTVEKIHYFEYTHSAISHTEHHKQVNLRCQLYSVLCSKGLDTGSAQTIVQLALPLSKKFYQ